MYAMPQSIFSWAFTIRRDGEPVAEIDPAWFGERAAVTAAGESYTLTQESLLRGEFAMRSGDQVVASARKPSVFARAFEVDLPGRRFELSAITPWGNDFGLFEGGSRLGQIGRAGWLGWKSVIDLPEEVPTHEQVFLFWLVLLLWRRAASSSAAAAGGT
jgi:hypothetical protein